MEKKRQYIRNFNGGPTAPIVKILATDLDDFINQAKLANTQQSIIERAELFLKDCTYVMDKGNPGRGLWEELQSLLSDIKALKEKNG